MPESISIDIDMIAARRIIGNLPSALERALRGAMNSASALLLRELKTYPPTRAGQTYIRTGTLMRSWSRTPITGSGLNLRQAVGSNSSMAPYSRIVMDRAYPQGRYFRGRWSTVQDIKEQRESEIQNMFQARLRLEIDSL